MDDLDSIGGLSKLDVTVADLISGSWKSSVSAGRAGGREVVCDLMTGLMVCVVSERTLELVVKGGEKTQEAQEGVYARFSWC